jgi:hypothetical protein
MDTIRICYRFTLASGTQEIFDLKLDARTLELKDNIPTDPPAWTKLSYHQCPNCPLPEREEAPCPAAANLVDLVRGFEGVRSHETIRVEVETAERAVAQDLAAQRAVGSIMGLIMAVSGCPHTAFFRPMARFHAPWASDEETIYRATSMYLLAQYFKRESGQDSEFGLEGLSTVYENVRQVNGAFIERLHAASREDSTLNALVVLDMLALTMPLAISDSLERIRYLFEPFLGTPVDTPD